LKVICLLVTSGAALNASNLWNNGAPNTNFGNANPPSDFLSSGVGPFTVFDSFTVGPTGWLVTGFDITDFFVNTPTTDYSTGGKTTWSVWNGDPLTTGQLVMTGSATGGLTNYSGTCGSSSTCLETITVGGLNVSLKSGTYYLGTYNTLASNSDLTYRATSTGRGAGWESSNGAIVGSKFVKGEYPNTSNGGDTAFDIQGNVAPEPGTMVLMGLALAGLGYQLRRRSV